MVVLPLNHSEHLSEDMQSSGRNCRQAAGIVILGRAPLPSVTHRPSQFSPAAWSRQSCCSKKDSRVGMLGCPLARVMFLLLGHEVPPWERRHSQQKDVESQQGYPRDGLAPSPAAAELGTSATSPDNPRAP